MYPPLKCCVTQNTEHTHRWKHHNNLISELFASSISLQALAAQAKPLSSSTTLSQLKELDLQQGQLAWLLNSPTQKQNTLEQNFRSQIVIICIRFKYTYRKWATFLIKMLKENIFFFNFLCISKVSKLKTGEK